MVRAENHQSLTDTCPLWSGWPSFLSTKYIFFSKYLKPSRRGACPWSQTNPYKCFHFIEHLLCCMFQFLYICCLLRSFTLTLTSGLLHWTIASMLCVAASTSGTSREIPTRPGSKPPSLPSQPYSHHPGILKTIISGLPDGHRDDGIQM